MCIGMGMLEPRLAVRTLRSASGGAPPGCADQCRPSLSMRAVTCDTYSKSHCHGR